MAIARLRGSRTTCRNSLRATAQNVGGSSLHLLLRLLGAVAGLDQRNEHVFQRRRDFFDALTWPTTRPTVGCRIDMIGRLAHRRRPTWSPLPNSAASFTSGICSTIAQRV